MYAIDIGTSRVIQLPASASIREAARTMKMQDTGCIVAVESSAAGAMPIGIVTDRDIAMYRMTGEDAIGNRALGTVMSRPIAVCNVAASVDEVIRIMYDNHLRRLPIVDDAGILAGIVSIDDVVRTLAGLMARVAQTLADERMMDHTVD